MSQETLFRENEGKKKKEKLEWDNIKQQRMIKSEQAELQKETEGKTRCVTEIEATIEATINRINMN